MNRQPTNRIKEIREARNLSMAQLGERVGATASQISKLEKNQVQLTVEWMRRLGNALNCRPVDLMLDAPPPPTHINEDLLRHAIYVYDNVFDAEPPDNRMAVMASVIAAVYDVLVETVLEGGTVDDQLLGGIIKTHRRNLQR